MHLPEGGWQQRGFRGGPSDLAEEGNLAATYSALAALVALGADLTADVDGEALVRALGSLQQEDGRWGSLFRERTRWWHSCRLEDKLEW